MITRNVQRVDAIHRARGLRGPLSGFGQGSLPPLQPGRDVLPWHELVERRRISAQFVRECAETACPISSVFRQQRQQIVDERPIDKRLGQTDLCRETGRIVSLVALVEGLENCRRRGNRIVGCGIDQRQQCFCQARQIPLQYSGLIAERIAAPVVDRAEHCRRIECVEEGARTVIDGLSRNCRVVGVHDPVHETDEHPPRHQ